MVKRLRNLFQVGVLAYSSMGDTDYSVFRDLLKDGPKSPDDLALACLHQPANLLQRHSGSSKDGYLRWSFGQLERVSDACAQAMAAAGLRPGNKVAAYIANCAEFHVLFRACLELNCTFCPVVSRTHGGSESICSY